LGKFWPTDVTPDNYWEFLGTFPKKPGPVYKKKYQRLGWWGTSVLSAVYENVCPYSNYTYNFNTSVNMQINVTLITLPLEQY